jgi:hypothetical protein
MDLSDVYRLGHAIGATVRLGRRNLYFRVADVIDALRYTDEAIRAAGASTLDPVRSHHAPKPSPSEGGDDSSRIDVPIGPVADQALASTGRSLDVNDAATKESEEIARAMGSLLGSADSQLTDDGAGAAGAFSDELIGSANV